MKKFEKAVDILMHERGLVWCSICDDWVEGADMTVHVHDVHTQGHNATNDCC